MTWEYLIFASGFLSFHDTRGNLGNASDNSNALDLTEKAEANLDQKVDKAVGDCAYGDGATRAEFVEAGRQGTGSTEW